MALNNAEEVRLVDLQKNVVLTPSEEDEKKALEDKKAKFIADAATADANKKAEPTGKGAAAKPEKNQSKNDTAKQTPEDRDLGTAREEAEKESVKR